MIRPLLFQLALFACAILIPYQSSSQANQYHFTHQDIKLRNSRIETITQDSYGYIWIGTHDGLNKYDGSNIVSYYGGNGSNRLNGSRIEFLFEDSKRRLWVTTEEGIYQYQRNLDNFKRLAIGENDQTSPSRTEAITEDENGVVWLGTIDNGLFFFDESVGRFVKLNETVPESAALHTATVNTITADHESNLWIGTESSGLWMLDSSRQTLTNVSHLLPNDLASKRIYKLLVDKNNLLWLGFHRHGILKIDPKNQTVTDHYQHDPQDSISLFNNVIVNLYEDSNGNIWSCNENGGLHQYDQATNGFYRFLPLQSDLGSISDISTKVIIEDDKGRIWAASNLSGIDIHDPYLNHFEVHRKRNEHGSLNNNIVRDFLEINDNELLVATDGGGLNILNLKSRVFEHITVESTSNGIMSDAVLALEKDIHGKVWMGTWNGSINIYDPKTGAITQPYANSSNVERVFSIFRDSKNNMWVGDQVGSVTKYDPNGKWLNNYKNVLGDTTSLKGRNVVTLTEDSEGQIWVGTEFNGISVLTNPDNVPPVFHRVRVNPNDPTALPNSKINHIFCDQIGNVWVASEGGLSLYDATTETFRTFRSSDGFQTGPVKSIAQDLNGNIWLGTSNGLSMYNQDSGEVRHFTSDDGLQSDNFSRYSALLLQDGRIAFGGFKGFNIFSPDELTNNPHPPKPILTGLKIFNEPVKIDTSGVLSRHISMQSKLTLTHEHSVFTMEYAGLGFTQSSRNQFAFRLDGLEKQWNYVGNRQQATYTNLDPGKYTFILKSANNEGIWSEPLTLAIEVVPPWYSTWWFRLCLGFALIFGIVILFKYRIYSIKKNERQLEALVQERSKEIENLNRNLALSEKMASLGTMTAGIAHEINNPLNYISGATQQLFELYENERGDIKDDDKALYHTLKEMIKEGIRRTVGIVRSLNNYSWDNGKSRVEHNITTCAEDALKILNYKLKNKSINVQKSYPEEVLVKCMPARISQVFINIIDNAIDSVDDNGTISIEVFSDPDQVLVRISDNGHGISADYQNKLFDPFFTTKEVGKGSGLGLYIVYGIIKDHNGQISANSQSNKTTFTFSLPHKT